MRSFFPRAMMNVDDHAVENDFFIDDPIVWTIADAIKSALFHVREDATKRINHNNDIELEFCICKQSYLLPDRVLQMMPLPDAAANTNNEKIPSEWMGCYPQNKIFTRFLKSGLFRMIHSSMSRVFMENNCVAKENVMALETPKVFAFSSWDVYSETVVEQYDLNAVTRSFKIRFPRTPTIPLEIIVSKANTFTETYFWFLNKNKLNASDGVYTQKSFKHDNAKKNAIAIFSKRKCLPSDKQITDSVFMDQILKCATTKKMHHEKFIPKHFYNTRSPDSIHSIKKQKHVPSIFLPSDQFNIFDVILNISSEVLVHQLSAIQYATSPIGKMIEDNNRASDPSKKITEEPIETSRSELHYDESVVPIASFDFDNFKSNPTVVTKCRKSFFMSMSIANIDQRFEIIWKVDMTLYWRNMQESWVNSYEMAEKYKLFMNRIDELIVNVDSVLEQYENDGHFTNLINETGSKVFDFNKCNSFLPSYEIEVECMNVVELIQHFEAAHGMHEKDAILRSSSQLHHQIQLLRIYFSNFLYTSE